MNAPQHAKGEHAKPAQAKAGHAKAGHAKAGHAKAGHAKAHARAGHAKPAHARAGHAKSGGKARTAAHRSAPKKVRHKKPWRPVLGIDSSMSVPPSSLGRSGIHFEARYIVPGYSKSLTRGELAAMQRRGVRLVAIWERGATDMLGGYPAGKWAAQQAQRSLRQLRIPHAVVYFCADFDAAPYQQAAINNYLRGAASVVGWRRTGLYGSYWVVSRAFNAHVIRFGWQTYAWSGGHWDSRAALHQYKVNQSHAGVPVDLNVAVHRDYGAVYPRR